MKIAVIGATGLVGRMMVKVLEERNLDFEELLLFASERSSGETLKFHNKDIPIKEIKEGWDKEVDFALLAVDETISKKIVEQSHEEVTFIDNSSAFRLDPKVPLVVPEINFDTVKGDEKVIANPNCSTIQLVISIKPLMEYGEVESVFVSTYQSVSGAGKEGVEQLFYEREFTVLNQIPPEEDSPFPARIVDNVIPFIGEIKEGYCKEEWKLIKETEKILKSNFPIFPATARVPVVVGHLQSVSVVFKSHVNLEEVEEILKKSPGLKIEDSPMPMKIEKEDGVILGRLRVHPQEKRVLQFFSVMNNLRKGAATNAVQILEKILSEKKK